MYRELIYKIPNADAITGERFISTESFDTTNYYSEWVGMTEESKANGEVNLLLMFRFNLKMNHSKRPVENDSV